MHLQCFICVLFQVLLLGGCDSGANSKISKEEYDRYGEKLDTIKTQVDTIGSQAEGELRAILEDKDLSGEKKAQKIAAILDELLSKIDKYLADFKQIQPPSDLRPLHSFLISDLQVLRSLYIELRDAFKLQNQEKINSVAERFNANDRDRKHKLEAAFKESGIDNVKNVSSLKEAISRRRR